MLWESMLHRDQHSSLGHTQPNNPVGYMSSGEGIRTFWLSVVRKKPRMQLMGLAA
jgi:hypothetical protein